MLIFFNMSTTLKYITASLVAVGLVIFGLSLVIKTTTNNIVQSSSVIVPNSKIKIGYLATTNSLPLYLAQEKGYLKEAGLDAELIKFEAPNLFTDAIVANQIDATAPSLATGIMSIVETKNQGKFIITGSNYTSPEHAGDVVVIPIDSAAATFSDLRGKTCGTLAGPQFKTIFTKLAKDSGLKAALSGTEGDIFYKELPATEIVTGLGSKGIDCIVGLEPAGTVAIAKNVGKLLGASPISQSVGGGRFYGGISAINSDFTNKNPEAAKKFVAVMDKAIKEIQTNEKESRQYLAKYLNITEPLISNVKLPYFRTSTDLNAEDFKYIDTFLSNFEEQGVYKTKPDLSKLIYKE